MRHELIGLMSASALASTLMAAGCGGGDDAADPGGAGGSGSSGFTTLSGTTSLSALTPAQATQLCNDTYAHFGTAITDATMCKWKGLAFATSSSAPSPEQYRANCVEKETSCLADPAAARSNNPGCSSFPGGCTATVAEYSTCVNDQIAFFNQTVAGIAACAEFSSTSSDAVWAALGAMPPASCTFSNCTGLYPPNPLF